MSDRSTRRQFLAKTAAVAGAAGAASVLPSGSLVRAITGAGTTQALPPASEMPIDTFVVLMMENRSFDHYFGWFPGADGFKTVNGVVVPDRELSYPEDPNVPGSPTEQTHRLAPDFQGCQYSDPNHDWDGGREEFNNGALDGFLKVNDPFAIGYYLEDDLPFIPSIAREFTLYDRYFCSILGPTYVNRHYQWSAQSGGTRTNVIPAGTLGQKWETIFDRAQSQGVTVRYYNSDLPFGLLYGSRAQPWIRPVSEFYADAAAGELPQICFVDPPFTDGGGGDGLSADEHPHGDIRLGQAFMAQIVGAFLNSPQWQSGAMFVNYDEWGGFFDHVAPPKVPDDLESANLANDFGQTGFRVPGVAISPWARRGHVAHGLVTHESILKLISYRFNLGYLNKRHRYATNIGYSFDWENPDMSVPSLPTVIPPVTTSCTAQGFPATSESAAEEESTEGPGIGSQEMIDYVERFGFKYEPWKPSDIFADPDAVTKALQGKG